ncbi:hypothetical protein PR048_028965 [Dryococelus australis]|uniref:Uncharacterized protein n=1 Tax=Dryococelus australis TaxID=614101 RepID=A0ABQ9GFN6_9NEOP|nr:hypothetical protein PR048_028965 [Dryococelus australis]
MTADNQCAADVGIFVHTSVHSGLQVRSLHSGLALPRQRQRTPPFEQHNTRRAEYRGRNPLTTRAPHGDYCRQNKGESTPGHRAPENTEVEQPSASVAAVGDGSDFWAAALNNEALRTDEGEMRLEWSGAGKQMRGKREIPMKTCQPMAPSGTIPTCENPERQHTRWSREVASSPPPPPPFKRPTRGFIDTCIVPGCSNIFPDPRSNDPSSEPGSSLILVPTRPRIEFRTTTVQSGIRRAVIASVRLHNVVATACGFPLSPAPLAISLNHVTPSRRGTEGGQRPPILDLSISRHNQGHLFFSRFQDSFYSKTLDFRSTFVTWTILTVTRCRCLPANHGHSVLDLPNSDWPSQGRNARARETGVLREYPQVNGNIQHVYPQAKIKRTQYLASPPPPPHGQGAFQHARSGSWSSPRCREVTVARASLRVCVRAHTPEVTHSAADNGARDRRHPLIPRTRIAHTGETALLACIMSKHRSSIKACQPFSSANGDSSAVLGHKARSQSLVQPDYHRSNRRVSSLLYTYLFFGTGAEDMLRKGRNRSRCECFTSHVSGSAHRPPQLDKSIYGESDVWRGFAFRYGSSSLPAASYCLASGKLTIEHCHCWSTLGIGRSRAAPECKGLGKRKNPEKICRPAASSGMIPACENFGASPLPRQSTMRARCGQQTGSDVTKTSLGDGHATPPPLPAAERQGWWVSASRHVCPQRGCTLRTPGHRSCAIFRYIASAIWCTSLASHHMFVTLATLREVNMEQYRNEIAGETGDPRENPPSGMIPTCKNPGALPPGIQLGSPS